MDILNNTIITYDSIKACVDANNKEIDNYSVKMGDLLFQRSSETLEDVGRANVYMDEKPAIFGGFVIRGKKKENIIRCFLRTCWKLHFLVERLYLWGQVRNISISDKRV